MATPPDEFFHKQELALFSFADLRTRKVLKYLESARRELVGIIAEPDTFTASRISSLTRQIDEIRQDVRRNILAVGNGVSDLAHMVKDHLQASASMVAERGILIAFDKLNLDILHKFASLEINKVAGLTEIEIEGIKSILFSKVGVQGQNPAQVAKQIAGKDSPYVKKYGVIENIMRTNTSTVYNAQATEGIKTINQKYDLELNKRIVETMDSKRNHPISQLLNNQVQTADGKFKVSVAAVAAKARALHKGSGGVLWPVVDGFYVGDRLPAHYRERGVMVPTEQDVTQ